MLSGTGTLRVDGETVPLRERDYVAFPADRHGAHRVVNDGDDPLVYLMVSTMDDPDITVCSGKTGTFVGAPPGGQGERSLEGYYKREDTIGYWEDETR